MSVAHLSSLGKLTSSTGYFGYWPCLLSTDGMLVVKSKTAFWSGKWVKLNQLVGGTE